jgi:DNA-binding transcriptional regulator YhcF (GntR family)
MNTNCGTLISIDLRVNYFVSIPVFVQVKRIIRKTIMSGAFKIDERLPAVRRLAKESSISVVTIERAYRELVKEGVIRRERKIGYFVLDRVIVDT